MAGQNRQYFTYLVVATVFVSATGIFIPAYFEAQAARKYYPPGFTPPPDSMLVPGLQPKSQQAPNTKTTPSAPSTHTIIKTVPVYVRPKPSPKDPLTELIEEHRFTEASRLLEQRIKKSPGNLYLRLLKAQILRHKHNYDNAESEYRLILSKTRNQSLRAKAYSGLGETQFYHGLQAQYLGDTDEAESLLKKAIGSLNEAIRLKPRSVEPWVVLARLHLSQNRLKEAEAKLKRASQLSANHSGVLLTQSHLLLAQDKPDEALPIIFKARQLSPHNPEAPFLLGKAYLALERYDDAIIQLHQALEQTPDHAEALKLLSKAYEGKMKPQDAESALEKALALNPADVETAQALLKLYEQRGETDRSILLLKSILKDQPQQPAYQAMLLKELIRASRWEEAYANGSGFIGQYLADKANGLEKAGEVLPWFAQAAYVEGKTRLDFMSFQQQPEIQAVIDAFKTRIARQPHNLEHQLYLLMLNPFAKVPALPQATAIPETQTATAAKIAFLQGDYSTHNILIQRLANIPNPDVDAQMALSRELLFLGDYDGAKALALDILKHHSDSEQAFTLARSIAQARQQGETALRDLKKLGAKAPQTPWTEAAQGALRLYHGYFKLHATLADALMDRKDYQSALTQQRFAAQFAPSQRAREHWLKKVRKTQERLGNR